MCATCYIFINPNFTLFVLITISNTRSKRVNENITRQCPRQEKKNVYMQTFMFVGVPVIEILLFNRKKKEKKKKNMATVKIEIKCITPRGGSRIFEGGAGLAGLLRNLPSQGRSHTPPR